MTLFCTFYAAFEYNRLQFGVDFATFPSGMGVFGKGLKRNWGMRYLKLCIPFLLIFFMVSSADANLGSSNPPNVVAGPLAQVPEPGVLMLLGIGLVAVAIWAFIRRRKKS
jgi:hypothetical protein